MTDNIVQNIRLLLETIIARILVQIFVLLLSNKGLTQNKFIVFIQFANFLNSHLEAAINDFCRQNANYGDSRSLYDPLLYGLRQCIDIRYTAALYRYQFNWLEITENYVIMRKNYRQKQSQKS